MLHSEEFEIDPTMRAVSASLRLGVVSATVAVTETPHALSRAIDARVDAVAREVAIDEIPRLPAVAALRAAYKACGTSPSRYRGSAEALLRRAVQGKGLYTINNVVDINNLVSLESQLAVGSYDLDRIAPPFSFRVGRQGERYHAIGKGEMTVERLPLFADRDGPFGSPTSDSERANICGATRRIAMVLVDFGSTPRLQELVNRASSLLRQHAGAEAIDCQIVV